jgi:prepilin-type N-terminal cleavage/methylation domain-containing protein
LRQSPDSGIENAKTPLANGPAGLKIGVASGKLSASPLLNSPASAPIRRRTPAFTLIELMVVISIIAVMMALLMPVFNNISGSSGITRATNDVAGMLELARAEAMATRTYVYIGFANATNTDGNSELRIGAVMSLDGSSGTAPANLRPITKLVKIPNVRMTDYSTLPQVVKDAADITLRSNDEYVTNFAPTPHLKDKFGDSAFDSCPTVSVSPQGELLHATNPTVFFRTTGSVGLVLMRGTVPATSDGAIVSYYGGTGQLRVTRPR